MSIPSAYYGRDSFALSFEEGLDNLVRDAGIANVINTVDGMLYHLSSVILPDASDSELVNARAEARVLRRMKQHLIGVMEQPDPEEEEELTDG